MAARNCRSRSRKSKPKRRTLKRAGKSSKSCKPAKRAARKPSKSSKRRPKAGKKNVCATPATKTRSKTSVGDATNNAEEYGQPMIASCASTMEPTTVASTTNTADPCAPAQPVPSGKAAACCTPKKKGKRQRSRTRHSKRGKGRRSRSSSSSSRSPSCGKRGRSPAKKARKVKRKVRRSRSSGSSSSRSRSPSACKPCKPKRVGPPTKAASAYILFFRDFIKEKKKTQPCIRVSEVSKEAGKAWRKLSKAKKAEYRARYCAEKKRLEAAAKSRRC